MPFLESALIGAFGSMMGRRDEGRQNRENTILANKLAAEQAAIAFKRNIKATDKANRFNVKQGLKAEKRSDQNVKQAMAFNAQEANKARNFSRAEANKANALSEERDLRNRAWAQEDYNQQKEDFSTQFQRSREAAVAAGFNPLSVLGSQMTPSVGAGGLSSSSYGGGGAVGASSGFATATSPTSSVPMAYGAPVAVQPLASNASIVGAIGELGQELTGVNAVQRQTEQLERDLAQIELDQLRSGVSYPERQPGPPMLGSTASPVGDTSTTPGVNWTDPSGTEWRNGNPDPNGMPEYYRYNEAGDLVEYVPTPQSTMYGIVDNQVLSGPSVVAMDPSGELLNTEQVGLVGAQLGAQEIYREVQSDSARAAASAPPDDPGQYYTDSSDFYADVNRRMPDHVNNTIPLMGLPPAAEPPERVFVPPLFGRDHTTPYWAY